VCGGLQELGVKPGDRVPLVSRPASSSSPPFSAPCWPGGARPPVPAVRLGRLAEYHRRTARMVEAVGGEVVLATGGQAPARRVDGAGRPRWGCRTLDELPEGPPRRISRRSDDLALVQFSSGTTSTPSRSPEPPSRGGSDTAPEPALARHPRAASPGGVVAAALPRHGPDRVHLPGPGAARAADPDPAEDFIVRPALWLRAISASGRPCRWRPPSPTGCAWTGPGR